MHCGHPWVTRVTRVTQRGDWQHSVALGTWQRTAHAGARQLSCVPVCIARAHGGMRTSAGLHAHSSMTACAWQYAYGCMAAWRHGNECMFPWEPVDQGTAHSVSALRALSLRTAGA
jgi:hypothetical protein